MSAGAQPNASAWLMSDNPRQGSSNDCRLECDAPEDLALLTPQQKLYIDPPYRINSANGQPINQRTLGVTAVHADGSLEYNAHNLYGLTEAAATYSALKDITGKRPFMLTRSDSSCAHAWHVCTTFALYRQVCGPSLSTLWLHSRTSSAMLPLTALTADQLQEGLASILFDLTALQASMRCCSF